MSLPLRHALFVLALLSAVGLGLVRNGFPPAPSLAPQEYAVTPSPPSEPLFSKGFVFERGLTPVVHSGTLALAPGGGLLAAWFGGSREGAGDVAIYQAHWSGGRWDEPSLLIDRPGAARDLGIYLRKLGNPVLYRAPGGRLWLFFVVASMGGWSTSSVAFQTSDDGGRSWTRARRLVTSPFLNISTLVRTRPLALAGEEVALPVYHELAGKFGELLRLAPDGRVLNKSRMGSGRSGIQPTLAASGPGAVQAWLRRVGDSPHRVLLSASPDAGAHWSPPVATGLPNPDASVAALRTGGGGFLLAYNPSPGRRNALALARSRDGRHWRPVTTLEQGADDEEYSYPFLIRGDAHDYHLIYTWRRTHMAHVHFNDAWLEGLP